MKALLAIATVILVFSLSIPLLAHGRSPLEARKALAQLRISYSIDAFMYSAQQGDRVAVQLFLEAGMEVNTQGRNGWTALAQAAEKGHITTMQVLLNAGADTTVALQRAALLGVTQSVQALLEAGVKRQAQDHALLVAAERGHAPVVQVLLAAGTDVNTSSTGWTALMSAAKGGHTAVVHALLAAGADVQAKMSSVGKP